MESLWEKNRSIPEFPRLPGDIRTDVLVIGGGLAGLLTAYCLTQKGISVVLVEKERICSGVTSGTTAKITAQHGLIYHKLLNDYGKEYAQMYHRANARGVERLKDLCRKAGCRLEEKDNFVYSTDPMKLEAELTALQKIGVDAKFTPDIPFPVEVAGAVGFANQGQFDPPVLAAYLAKDLTIYEHTKVRAMIGTTAETEHGKIAAKKVVVATHFPFINKHGSYFLKLYQHRSYLTAWQNTRRIGELYVDDSQTGYSFSSFGDYFLLGGGGHRTGKQGGSYPELISFMGRYDANARECFRWATQDTMSLDGIPYIGNYSKHTPDLYVAAGFNKWGMTGSMVSAEILSAMIAGETPEDAAVFSPSRSIWKPQLLVNGLESTKNLLTPTPKRCPHLGCALKYNKEERSWDCPCHGSRFSETGKLLDNPANDDLKK